MDNKTGAENKCKIYIIDRIKNVSDNLLISYFFFFLSFILTFYDKTLDGNFALSFCHVTYCLLGYDLTENNANVKLSYLDLCVYENIINSSDN